MKSILLVLVLSALHVTCQSQPSFSPILKQVKAGDLTALQKSIADGADINAHYEPGYTLLCGAVRSNQITIVQYLIDEGADLNKFSNKKSPLMYAAKYGYLDIAKLLIEKGAAPNLVSPNGRSALNYAVKYEQPDLVDFLKE